jgi:hypothetical protein
VKKTPPAKDEEEPPVKDGKADSKGKPRPHINMYFKCCNVYAYIYLNHEGTAFAGNCPRCARPVRIKAGRGGSRSKFWTAE